MNQWRPSATRFRTHNPQTVFCRAKRAPKAELVRTAAAASGFWPLWQGLETSLAAFRPPVRRGTCVINVLLASADVSEEPIGRNQPGLQ